MTSTIKDKLELSQRGFSKLIKKKIETGKHEAARVAATVVGEATSAKLGISEARREKGGGKAVHL